MLVIKCVAELILSEKLACARIVCAGSCAKCSAISDAIRQLHVQKLSAPCLRRSIV
jgi:hypothetical protein